MIRSLVTAALKERSPPLAERGSEEKLWNAKCGHISTFLDGHQNYQLPLPLKADRCVGIQYI